MLFIIDFSDYLLQINKQTIKALDFRWMVGLHITLGWTKTAHWEGFLLVDFKMHLLGNDFANVHYTNKTV